MNASKQLIGLALLVSGFWRGNMNPDFRQMMVMRMTCDVVKKVLCRFFARYECMGKCLNVESIFSNKNVTRVAFTSLPMLIVYL